MGNPEKHHWSIGTGSIIHTGGLEGLGQVW